MKDIPLATSPEDLLISSVLRDQDYVVAVQHGIGHKLFHARQDEWKWIEDYYSKNRKCPSKGAFRNKFPDFAIKAVNDTAHFVGEVRRTHSRIQLVSVMRDASDLIADGDVDKAFQTMQRSMITVAADMGGVQDYDIINDWQHIFDEVALRKKRYEEDGMAGIPTGFDTFDERTGGLQGGQLMVVGARPGQGKALTNTTRVATPNGWTTMGAIKAGDKVIGSNGKPVTVTAVYPQGLKQVHEVVFTDGTVIDACEDHLWTVRDNHMKWKTVTTKDIMNWSGRRYTVPTLSAPVEYDTDNSDLYDPYQMGILLGDGCFRGKTVTITIGDPELAIPFGDKATRWADGITWNISGAKKIMESYGLYGHLSIDKFIPEPYMTASPADRHALLQGLFDTDGSATNAGSVEFSTSSEKMAYQVKLLVESLGGVSTLHRRKTTHNDSFRMVVAMPPNMPGFRLERKLAKWKARDKYVPARRIAEVRKTERYEEMTCITVDAVDSLFVVENYIITHNTWSLMRMATTALSADYNVHFSALEMSRAEVGMRIHNFLSKNVGKTIFQSLALAQGRDFDLKSYKEFLSHLKDNTKSKFTVSDTRKIGAMEIASQLERHRPDIYFLDYLTLAKTGAVGDWQDIGRFSKDLKILAGDYNIPIVTASQLNRSSGIGKHDIGTEALSGADAIGQDADGVIIMKKLSERVIEYSVAKYRHGQSGYKWYAHMEMERGIFKEVSANKAQDLQDEDEQRRIEEEELS